MAGTTIEERISNSHYQRGREFERTSKVFTRRLVQDHPPLRILDIGCGTGLNAEHLAAKGHTVIGADVSPVAIAKFRAKGWEGVVWDIGAAALPWGDGSFDMVFASEVIEHVADTEAFLTRAGRVLRPGGTLILSTPNSAFWAFRLLGLMGQTASEYQHPGHVRFFSRRSLAAAVESAGFTIRSFSARHMYCLCNAAIGDRLAPVLSFLGFAVEPRFATGGHFWQLSGFAARASSFWADTFIVVASKPQ
jgi:2-polyprenyl-3-methyl-5-hydroxy-6-metoxy-1,4-benzoquinol methylase